VQISSFDEWCRSSREEYSTPDLKVNQAYQYAVLRNILYRKGKTIEILANYEPSLQYFSEWWKQLAGESEGKDYKGFTQHQLTSQQICTQSVNLSKKVAVTSLKQ
jgi:glucose-6-phosphate isomerase